MGISLNLLRRARTGIALSRCGWVCVYAPMWPGISFWRYPFLDLRLEKWVDRWVNGWVGVGRWVGEWVWRAGVGWCWRDQLALQSYTVVFKNETLC